MSLSKYLVLTTFWVYASMSALAMTSDSSVTVVRKTSDFKVTGDGSSPNWSRADWIALTIQEGSSPWETRAKILYSEKGIYFLFDCQDEKLTATMTKDFLPLFKEDVVEVFLWPDTKYPLYFEYELSPLNYEWPLLVPNIDGRISGWHPFHYEGERKVQHATSVVGGNKVSHARISRWYAEMFIPYSLLSPLLPHAPETGTRWRANLYRIDYDKEYDTWTWQKTTKGKPGNFHEYDKFGTLLFE